MIMSYTQAELSIQELDTVGINYIRTNGTYSNANTWYFTENALRREHGLYERVRY